MEWLEHQHGTGHPSVDNINSEIRIKEEANVCIFHYFVLMLPKGYMYKTLMNIEFTTHKIIWLLDVREYTTSYANHPKELIDIITRVANKPCKGNIQCQDLRPKVN